MGVCSSRSTSPYAHHGRANFIRAHRSRIRRGRGEKVNTLRDLGVYLPLYKAAVNGDWRDAGNFLEQDPEALTARITIAYETALHIAVGTGKKIEFVENLVQKMSPEDLTLTDQHGETALSVAAAVGNIPAAKILINKNPNLPNISGKYGFPVHKAAQFCHKKTVLYLLSVTRSDIEPNPFVGDFGGRLLIDVIAADFYDIALALVRRYPEMATVELKGLGSALSVLARKSTVFSRGFVPIPWKFRHFFCPVTYIRKVNKRRLKEQQALELVKELCNEILELDDCDVINMLKHALHDAAKLGIPEIIEEIVDAFPPAIWFTDDENDYNVFQLAIMNRRENVFNLVHQMTDFQSLITRYIDSDENNMLHLVGRLPPSDRFTLVSGPAFLNAFLLDLNQANNLIVSAGGRTQQSSSHELRMIAYEAEDEVDTLVSEFSAFSFLYPGIRILRASKKLRILKDRTCKVKRSLDQHAEGSSKEVEACVGGSRVPKGHQPETGDLVIGIDHEIMTIVNLLTGRSKSDDCLLPVNRLAIVGTGGSGKTNLARSIYSHKTIMRQFNHKAWVSVSRGWDTSTVLHSILKQIQIQGKWLVSAKPDNNQGKPEDEPRKLISLLQKLLPKKTCLLVLDDVWDFQSLHKFSELIQGDAFGPHTFTIVITSRQRPINWCIHQQQHLNDDESWKLLSKVAGKTSKAIRVDYHGFGADLLKKCEGLPLAIIALGRWLKKTDGKREWQKAQIEGEEIYLPVKEAVGLSYDRLPYYLKACFLYLGLFPEGSTVFVGTLIRKWIAEGFIKCCNDSHIVETVEVAGRRYLQELIDHSMVHVVSKTFSGKIKTIQLHDIMRDFCLWKAKEIDFLTVSSSSEPDAIVKTSRRAAIHPGKTIILPNNNSHLRSLAILGKSSTRAAPERNTSQANQTYLELVQVCGMHKLLRVLDICGVKSPDGTLPGEIGNLIHLTYLRIRTTNIRKLPKSIGKLRNLLTLHYWDVSVDTEIHVPNVLWKLKKLRHLYLPNEMSGMIKDLKIHTLKDLITLWGAGGGQWMPDEMYRLSSTLSKLYIHRISTDDQLKAVLSCPSMEKNGCLYALALDWYGFEFKNVNELLAKQSLTKLRLMGKAPDDLYTEGLAFPSNLGKLELHYTHLGKVETMEHLGRLAVLKVLSLSKDSYIGSEWSCGKGSFPVLEELKFTNLPKLEKWELEEGAMPCLKKLSIVSCINLKQTPEGLKRVQTLEKLDIERMSYDFVSRLQEVKGCKEGGGGEDYHIIKHIPQVIIRDSCTHFFKCTRF